MNKQSGNTKMGLIVMLVILAVVLITGYSFYGTAVSIRNQALAWETDLNSVYRANETELATYTNTVVEQLGLAGAKSEKMNELISAAVEGRYGDEGLKNGSLVTAIAEAYPDTKALDIYDKILPTVSAGREAFRNKQNMLMERAQAYDNWRKQGIFRAWVLSGIYPSADLSIKVDGKTLTGMDALEHLREPVINATTETSFKTHRAEPVIR